MSAPSSRRYLSVWLRRLATDRMSRARSPTPDEAPFVIAHPVKNAQRLAAVNDAAARLGLATGMALADAKAMFPALAVAQAEPEADRHLLEAVADWCDRYTPLVGIDPPDSLTLDITGCAHLFGGETALGHDIVHRLARQGLAARAAIADTVGCAWAVARYQSRPFTPSPPSGRLRPSSTGYGGEGRDEGVPAEQRCRNPLTPPSPLRGEGAHAPCPIHIIPPGATREALLPLKLMALRIAPETADGLAQAGLKRIADVIDRPRAPLAARFGVDFIRRIDQALGREDEPITPRLPLPAYVVERRFAEPILTEEDVLGTIEHLAHELARLLERRQEGARRLEVALFRTDGKVTRIEAGTGAPLREAPRMRALFTERLAAVGEACDPGFGFDVIRLAAPRVERSDPVQTGLAAPDHAAELMHLIDRLGARFGGRRITRPVPQDTHIPEFAVAARPAAADRSASSPPVEPVACARESLVPARPLRLFARPEPIEAIAEIPDGPPVRFRWRQLLHQVVRVEGPERIAMEWWHDRDGNALTRDYFCLECREGLRVWIYREGLYEHETTEPRWFLHGLFA